MLIAAGGFGNDVTVNVIASIIVSALFLAIGFLWGKYKERQRFGKKLEDYDFYPYAINRDNFPEFSLNNFRLGMHYFLRNFDPMAARQLIFIGEQNNVRVQLEPSEQKVYARLFARYDGKKIADDTREYLQNFERIVHLIGKSFPNIGIEILLHDLSNPSRSLVALENNVTGRHLHDGTTNLVIDLKKRQLSHEEKSNYELNLGARKFKCTTIAIVRPEYGVVGAVCINVDANYLTEEVMGSAERVAAFFQSFCHTEMQLDENILSRDEYAKALKGKRHFNDKRFD
ncbi:MAG: PAS domain-containing protein [Chthoniobacterales bacterium]